MKNVIERLDRQGGAVYLGTGTPPMVACWFGEKAGRLWFHLGDAPHWGPPLEDLEAFSDYGITAKDPSKGAFFACTLEEAGELRTGAAMDQVEDQREIMTRDEALAMLGDPPAASTPAPRRGEPDVEP